VSGTPAPHHAGPASATHLLAEDLRARREAFVMATVVRVTPPTSARAGDVALVRGDGRLEGFVGGECAESSVRAQAIHALATGEPVLLHIVPEGVAPAPGDPSDAVGTVTVHNPCLSGGALEIFLEPDLPPPLVVVHGEGPIAAAVADLVEHIGYVAASSAAGIPPDATAVVVASHGRDEHEALRAALAADVPYVGLVASRRRGAAVLDSLGLEDGGRARIRTPAGFDIGARSPGEVALAIVAEIVARRPRPVPAPPRGDEGGGEPGPGGDHGTGAVHDPARDPVCGMAVVAAAPSPSAEHGGARYWFCGTGCRQAFVDDPGAYAGQ
jgi:xanthine dehydrogenase accessory factor